MTLSTEQNKSLRKLGHQLNPIVRIAGNGLTENVINELNRALEDHELIKVKIAVGDRELLKETISQIVTVLKAESVQEVGHIALLYRPAQKPNPKLSNIIRLKR